MNNDIIVHSGSAIEISKLAETATDYMSAAREASTRRAYETDMRDFSSWCAARGLEPLPASVETIVLYLTDRAQTHKPVTLRRRVTSIGVAHQLAGVESQHRHRAVKDVLAGIARTHTVAPVQKHPLMTRDLRQIVKRLPNSMQGTRDRAILLIGLAGGFRRSELVGLNVEDVEFVEQGAVITLRKSKTDQEGKGALVPIPATANETSPVRWLRKWIEDAGIASGPLLRRISRADRVLGTRLTGKSIGLIVKRACTVVALDPDEFGAHSLRSGLATQAAEMDVPLDAIMTAGRWRSMQTVISRYIRRGSLFKDNAAGRIGL